jgi:hypothetical protein
MPIPEIAIGAIVAACIAGFLSFLGLVAAKEHKTSEFRQAWIDAAREDVALLIGACHAILDEYRVRDADLSTAWQSLRTDLLTANVAWARLRMRLNPQEAESQLVIKLIGEIETRLNEMPDQDDDSAMAELRQFVFGHTALLADAAGAIFKTEWKRVKRGEPIFRISKWVALVGGLTVASGLGVRLMILG